MPATRSALEVSAGNLTSAVQRKWGNETGTSSGEVTEHVVGLAHNLLMASKAGTLHALFGDSGVADYPGLPWVKRYPVVFPAILRLESLLFPGQHGQRFIRADPRFAGRLNSSVRHRDKIDARRDRRLEKRLVRSHSRGICHRD